MCTPTKGRAAVNQDYCNNRQRDGVMTARTERQQEVREAGGGLRGGRRHGDVSLTYGGSRVAVLLLKLWMVWKYISDLTADEPSPTRRPTSFRSSAPQFWSKVPESCRSAASLSSFNSRLKTFLVALIHHFCVLEFRCFTIHPIFSFLTLQLKLAFITVQNNVMFWCWWGEGRIIIYNITSLLSREHIL